MTFLNQEHKVGNRYQQPPAAAIRVVQPANTHRDTWDQHGQGVKVSDNAAIPDQPADKAEDNRDQDVEQKEHPVFFSACPAREHRVFFRTSVYQLHAGGLSVLALAGEITNCGAPQCGHVPASSLISFAQPRQNTISFFPKSVSY